MYITDADVKRFFEKLALSLAKEGTVVVKENVAGRERLVEGLSELRSTGVGSYFDDEEGELYRHTARKVTYRIL